MKTYLILSIVVLFLFDSCTTNTTDSSKVIQKEVVLLPPKSFNEALSNDQLTALGLNEMDRNFIHNLYASNNSSPFWFINDSITNKGKQLRNIFANMPLLGIPNERFEHLKLKDSNIYQLEILISYTLATLKNDLRFGFIDKENKTYKNLIPCAVADFKDLIKLGSDTCAVSTFLIRLGSDRIDYQQLAKGLYNYVSTTVLDTISCNVVLPAKDTGNWEAIAAKALDRKGIAPDTSITARLKKYQRRENINPNGILGEQTRHSLATTGYDKFLRAALSLERLRWKPKDPKLHVHVNIPEFTLRYYSDDTLFSVNKIIVGKPDTPTPELTSSIHQIILLPYWGVPQNIANEEILPAVKANSNYLVKNHYRIFRGKKEVNSAGINWRKVGKNMPYEVRQDYGPFNSLGLIKFDFHNKYGVYIHDTPKRRLFNNEFRSYSHGCMRCEFPVELGKLILLRDENLMVADSVDSMYVREIQTFIKLKKRIPIVVDYISVTADEKNKINFHGDIYYRDDYWIGIMKKEKKKKVTA